MNDERSIYVGVKISTLMSIRVADNQSEKLTEIKHLK